MTPIETASFDLLSSLSLAHEESEKPHDDPMLIVAPPDDDAKRFWTRVTASGTLSSSNTCSSTSKRPAADSDEKAKRQRCEDDEPRKRNGKNDRVHEKRRTLRDAQALKNGYHAVRPETVEAHVQGAKPIETDMSRVDFPVAGGGFTGLRSKLGEEGWFFKTIQDALDAGYSLVEWDGKTNKPLITKDGRVFAVLVGQPDDPSYARSCEAAYQAMDDEGRQANFQQSELHHKRGDYPAVNVGVTMGLGATYPTNLSSDDHAEMMSRLVKNQHIIRMAHFADGEPYHNQLRSFLPHTAAFNLWAPALHKEYRSILMPLFQKLDYLQPIFPRSVFPAAAFNFGPNVFTVAHRDCMNVPGGWCAIQALGRFDPKKGGHLVFPDLKLAVEFPPGALILIPSATLTHTNIPIQDGDCRASFTQYCAGGLFRYVKNDYQTESQLKKKNPKKYQEMCALKEARWQKDYMLYSLLTDLVAHVDNIV
ncbi:hypothetical protein H0H93_016282 [Arthromyces matolae]|nr:hypothetical protein H0H93_016282 [Arthromyces matolae]